IPLPLRDVLLRSWRRLDPPQPGDVGGLYARVSPDVPQRFAGKPNSQSGCSHWPQRGGATGVAVPGHDKREDPSGLWGRDAGAPRSLLGLLGPPALRRSGEHRNFRLSPGPLSTGHSEFGWAVRRVRGSLEPRLRLVPEDPLFEGFGG